MKKSFLLVLVLATVLTGCAHSGVKNAPMHFDKEIDLTMRPDQALGVRVTPSLEKGEVTVIEAPMSDSQIGAEMYPGRLSFPAWVVNSKGVEAFAQFLLTGNYPDGTFTAFIIIDGKLEDMKSAKFLPLSSKTEKVWNKEGEMIPIDRIRFYDEASYRKELVEKYGITVGSRRLVRGFDSMVKSWNRYSTENGDIYSPLSQDDIKRAAKINPGYSPVERFVLRNRTVLSINPFQTVATAYITVFEAITKKSKGWDAGSEISREQMAMIVEFIGHFRKEMIRERNEEIARKNAEIVKKNEEILKLYSMVDNMVDVVGTPKEQPQLKSKPSNRKVKVAERKKR